MSPKKPRKPRIRGTPIVLPGSFAGSKSAQDAAAQTKQIQDLIDLLKRNHLTDLEIERAGVRIRVRHEVAGKSVSATVTGAVPTALADDYADYDDLADDDEDDEVDGGYDEPRHADDPRLTKPTS